MASITTGAAQRRLSPELLRRMDALSGCRGRWIVDCRELEAGASYALRGLDEASFWRLPLQDGVERCWAAMRPDPAPYRRATPEDAALYCAATRWQSRLLFVPELLDDDCRWPGGYDAPSIIRSNARVFRDEYASELERADGDADGIALDVRYITPEMLETLAALESYPLISEDDHSELELELQDEAWESYVRDDWRRAIQKRLEDLAPEETPYGSHYWASDVADAISDETLAELLRSSSEAANVYWEEQCCGLTSSGFWIDLERCAEALTPEDLGLLVAAAAGAANTMDTPAPSARGSRGRGSRTITVSCASGPFDVVTVWRGQHLAVHRPIIRDAETGARTTSSAPARWAISHVSTGLSACPMFHGAKLRAVALARLWDNAFAEITASGTAKGWRWAQAWARDLQIAQHETYAEPQGPRELTALAALESARTGASGANG